jgi:hypothetical protein
MVTMFLTGFQKKEALGKLHEEPERHQIIAGDWLHTLSYRQYHESYCRFAISDEVRKVER